MFLGSELAHHPDFTPLQRFYIRLLGVPIVGLRIRARNVFSLIPASRNYGEILDAGCGLGVFAFELARRFPRANVLGIDLLPSMVQGAEHIRRKVGLENLRFQMTDLRDLPVGDRFDLAICVDILEHIEDDVSALQSLHRLLRPGGILVLHVPALYRRYPVWRKQQNFDVQGHVRPGYQIADIREKVRKVGFLCLEDGYTYGFLETLANNLSYRITRARMENRHLYALAFPVLNLLSWLGARSRPKELGAGIFLVAEKGAYSSPSA